MDSTSDSSTYYPNRASHLPPHGGFTTNNFLPQNNNSRFPVNPDGYVSHQPATPFGGFPSIVNTNESSGVNFGGSSTSVGSDHSAAPYGSTVAGGGQYGYDRIYHSDTPNAGGSGYSPPQPSTNKTEVSDAGVNSGSQQWLDFLNEAEQLIALGLLELVNPDGERARASPILPASQDYSHIAEVVPVPNRCLETQLNGVEVGSSVQGRNEAESRQSQLSPPSSSSMYSERCSTNTTTFNDTIGPTTQSRAPRGSRIEPYARDAHHSRSRMHPEPTRGVGTSSTSNPQLEVARHPRGPHIPEHSFTDYTQYTGPMTANSLSFQSYGGPSWASVSPASGEIQMPRLNPSLPIQRSAGSSVQQASSSAGFREHLTAPTQQVTTPPRTNLPFPLINDYASGPQEGALLARYNQGVANTQFFPPLTLPVATMQYVNQPIVPFPIPPLGSYNQEFNAPQGHPDPIGDPSPSSVPQDLPLSVTRTQPQSSIGNAENPCPPHLTRTVDNARIITPPMLPSPPDTASRTGSVTPPSAESETIPPRRKRGRPLGSKNKTSKSKSQLQPQPQSEGSEGGVNSEVYGSSSSGPSVSSSLQFPTFPTPHFESGANLYHPASSVVVDAPEMALPATMLPSSSTLPSVSDAVAPPRRKPGRPRGSKNTKPRAPPKPKAKSQSQWQDQTSSSEQGVSPQASGSGSSITGQSDVKYPSIQRQLRQFTTVTEVPAVDGGPAFVIYQPKPSN